MKRALFLTLSLALVLLITVACVNNGENAATTLSTETNTPEASATETVAPETVVPETVVPETVVPETVAPETVAPETTAPETEAHVHEFSDWEITKSATCTKDGERERRCSCGYVEVEGMNKTGHTEVKDAAVAATCTQTGLTEGKHCSVCKTVIKAQKTVKAKGHTEVVDPAVPATCTQTGLTEGKHCSVCKTVINAQETVEAKGHTEVVDAAVPATCTQAGLTEGKHCTSCDAVFVIQTSIPMCDHTYDGESDDKCNECEYVRDTEERSRINGVSLSEFVIVYSEDDHDYSKRAAEYIRAEILKRTGLELPLLEESEQRTTGYEIVVGETSRDISARLDADTDNVQFSILAEERQIALEGDSFIIAAAAYFFIETYVPEDDTASEIPKTTSVHDPIQKEANNYILLIGDGMGVNQTLLFDVMKNNISYSDGEDIFYGYYFPSLGFARTNSLSGTTDSAAAATALACGIKTKNAYIGQNKDHEAATSITELAATLGKSTAVMSTEASTGATPASFSAHANDRNLSDVILESQQVTKDTYGTIIDCNFNYYNDSGIKTIESKIASVLGTLGEDEDGFFLMYEEAHIDKYCHSNDMSGAFSALVRFNQVIGVFMEYAFYNPDTLVIITADHETGGLVPNGSGGYKYTNTGHTNSNVRIFAYGEGAQLFDGVTIENTQIPQTIAKLMGVDDFGDQ